VRFAFCPVEPFWIAFAARDVLEIGDARYADPDVLDLPRTLSPDDQGERAELAGGRLLTLVAPLRLTVRVRSVVFRDGADQEPRPLPPLLLGITDTLGITAVVPFAGQFAFLFDPSLLQRAAQERFGAPAESHSAWR
jgi:hypothetical protein